MRNTENMTLVILTYIYIHDCDQTAMDLPRGKSISDVSADGRFGVMVGILAYYARGRGFDFGSNHLCA
jgi:hypothetical protein